MSFDDVLSRSQLFDHHEMRFFALDGQILRGGNAQPYDFPFDSIQRRL